MKKLCFVIAGMLLAMSCTNVQKGKETENEQTAKTDTVLTAKSAAGNEDMAEPIKGDRFRVEIEKEKKDGNIETFCYAINPRTNEKRKVVFRGSEYDDWVNDGLGDLWSFTDPSGRYVFVVGDIKPNSNGWVGRFLVYRVDTENLQVKFFKRVAAVQPSSNGYRAAAGRLTNPDATCTAEEIWMLHDVYYDYNGNVVREDHTEYDYDELVKRYRMNL